MTPERDISVQQQRILEAVGELETACMADLLERVCGWIPDVGNGTCRTAKGGLKPTGNYYSRATIGAKRYRATSVSLLRAVVRLETRGLLAPAGWSNPALGFSWRARGTSITDAGRAWLDRRQIQSLSNRRLDEGQFCHLSNRDVGGVANAAE